MGRDLVAPGIYPWADWLLSEAEAGTQRYTEEAQRFTEVFSLASPKKSHLWGVT